MRLISCYFTLNGYISFIVYTVSTCPWLFFSFSFLFFCRIDLTVTSNKGNKFKNWLKYNNKCLIEFCADRVQVPDPLQYSNDCIRNASRSDEGIGKGSARGVWTDRKEKVLMEACLMRITKKKRKKCKRSLKKASSLAEWLYTISGSKDTLKDITFGHFICYPDRIASNFHPVFMPHSYGCYFASSGDHGFERKKLQKDPTLMHASLPPACFFLPPIPPHHTI